MRFSGILGALFALAAAPAFSQSTAPAPNTPGAAGPGGTLLPPGSTTPIPLVPGGAAPPPLPATPGGGLAPLPTFGAPTYPMPGYGQGMGGPGPSLSDVFSGTSSLPLNMKLGDLTSDWRRMTITGSLDFGTLTQMVTSLLASAGVGIYYTKGQSVTLGSTTYLVTYRTQPKAFDITSLMQMMQNAAATSKPPAPEKLTAQTPLTMTLLNLQTAGSLTDVQPFDLNREVTNSANAAKAFDDLINQMGSLGTTTPPTTVRPAPRRARPKAKSYTTT